MSHPTDPDEFKPVSGEIKFGKLWLKYDAMTDHDGDIVPGTIAVIDWRIDDPPFVWGDEQIRVVYEVTQAALKESGWSIEELISADRKASSIKQKEFAGSPLDIR